METVSPFIVTYPSIPFIHPLFRSLSLILKKFLKPRRTSYSTTLKSPRRALKNGLLKKDSVNSTT